MTPSAKKYWDALSTAPPGKKAAPPAKGLPKAPSNANEYWSSVSGTAPEKPLEVESPTGPPEDPNQGWFGKVVDFANTPLSRKVAGEDLGGLYDKVYRNIKAYMPEGYSDSWAGKVTEKVVRGVPEAADFLQSPSGIGLGLLHIFPVTLPVAIGIDGFLGIRQGLKTIPSVIDAAKDPQDPEKVAQAMKDVAMSFVALKGTRTLVGKPQFKGALDRPIEAKSYIHQLRNALPEEKLALADKLRTTETRREELAAKTYSFPIARTLAAILDVKKPKLMEAAAYLIDDRDNSMALANHEAQQFVYDFKRAVPTAERDVRKMGYVLEGSATADEVGLGAEARKWIPKIREWNRAADQMHRDAYGEDVKLHDPETYLMHRWGFENEGDMAHKGGGLGVGRRMLKDPQFRQRVIGTYREGIEVGINGRTFKPAHDDIADLIQARHKIAATAIANQRVANTLTEMGLIVSEDQAHANKKIAAWPTLESKPLERSAYSGKTASGDPVFQRRSVRVHPDIKMPVEALFGEGVPTRDPNTGTINVVGALEWLRAFGKQQNVGFSFFHHGALSEQFQAIELGNATNPIKGVGKAIRATAFTNPEFYRGIKSGLWEVAHKPERANVPPILGLKYGAAHEWIRHGLKIESQDAETGVVQQMRDWKVDSAHSMIAPILNKTVGSALHTLGNLHYINNRGLWDYYLPSQMMFSADTILTREMARRPGLANNPEQLAALKTEIAKHINKASGTETVSSMMLHPKTRFWMNFFLFAPVWTFSNFRVLSNAYQTEASHRLTGRWLGGAAFSWMVSTSLINYATTSWFNMPDRNGKKGGHFPWDNPGAPANIAGRYSSEVSENGASIAMGYNADGTEAYAHLAKGMLEPKKLFLDPLGYISGKLSPLPKAAIAITTKHEPGSGFEVIDDTRSNSDQAAQAGMRAAEVVTPFMAQDAVNWLERKSFPDLVPEKASSQATLGPIPLGLPMTKGLSATRAKQAYREAMTAGHPEVAVKVLEAADANHLNRKSIIASYHTWLKRKANTARGPKVAYDRYGNVQDTPPPPKR